MFLFNPIVFCSLKAVLIGINYEGQQGQLSGCHNDVKNIKKYLMKNQGFKEKDMIILRKIIKPF
mgnify:CR=1 FL=1